MGKPRFQLHRYHKDVFFPDNMREMVVEFIKTFQGDVDLTEHATEQMYADRRGRIPLPTNSELLDNKNTLVEFYERIDKPNRIQKMVIRVGGLSEEYDYSYVVARDGVIVTTWANDKTDHHRLTESKEQYIQGSSDKRL